MGILKINYSTMIAVLMMIACTATVQAQSPSADSSATSPDSNTVSLTDYLKKSEAQDDSISDALHKMTLAVLLVAALAVAAIYTSKKVLPKFAQSQGKKIQIVETIHLGNRKTVHLLEVGGQQILIGSTHDNITKLADIYSENGFPLSPTHQSEKAK